MRNDLSRFQNQKGRSNRSLLMHTKYVKSVHLDVYTPWIFIKINNEYLCSYIYKTACRDKIMKSRESKKKQADKISKHGAGYGKSTYLEWWLIAKMCIKIEQVEMSKWEIKA